jgi:hypothetical protein
LPGWACFLAASLREETLATGISIPLRGVVNTHLLPSPSILPSAICSVLILSFALERHSISLIDRDHGAAATTHSVGLCHSLVVLLLFYFRKTIDCHIHVSQTHDVLGLRSIGQWCSTAHYESCKTLWLRGSLLDVRDQETRQGRVRHKLIICHLEKCLGLWRQRSVLLCRVKRPCC